MKLLNVDGETAIFFLPAALLLDLLLGDPLGLPHPIRWMGRAIELGEFYFRKFSLPAKLSGAAMAFSLILSTWLFSWLLLRISGVMHPVLGWAAAVTMLYYTISVRSLYDAARAVWKALVVDDLELARQCVGRIVGRETARLDRQGVIRAAVETVAENLVDGVVSPFFYALLGGPALAMTYKMVNTLDSMIGYKNERYRDFGFAAAKIDDAANYLPARLTVPVIAVAAQMLHGTGRIAWQTAWREGRRHTSPNAGFSEAAFAGALDIRLGGPNYYHGQLVGKPYIGEQFAAAQTKHIARACDMMILSALIWATICWGGTIGIFLSRIS
jgi:adenosylcobinamide-phosphate synthase